MSVDPIALPIHTQIHHTVCLYTQCKYDSDIFFSKSCYDHTDILLHSKSSEVIVFDRVQPLYLRQEDIFQNFSQTTFKFRDFSGFFMQVGTVWSGDTGDRLIQARVDMHQPYSLNQCLLWTPTAQLSSLWKTTDLCLWQLTYLQQTEDIRPFIHIRNYVTALEINIPTNSTLWCERSFYSGKWLQMTNKIPESRIRPLLNVINFHYCKLTPSKNFKNIDSPLLEYPC